MRKAPRKRSSASASTSPSIEKGQEIARVIFGRTRKPQTRAALQTALDPIVRAWLRATCIWKDPEIGDHRFVVFSIEVAPETCVYVQFWSEPLEPVLWEVSSGRWNPPTDKWLAGDRSHRIESFGFEIGGTSENYVREVTINSATDLARVAREVVDIFYSAFDYRGAAPIEAKLVYQGRSELRPTFDAFTPEDISKIFAAAGFRVEEALMDDDEVEEPPMLRCRKRGTFTIVEFLDQVEDQNLYRRVKFSCEFEVSQEQAKALSGTTERTNDGLEPVLAVSVVHPVGGGVTVDWLIERIQEWNAMIAAHRRELRRPGRARPVQTPHTVH